MGRVAIFDDFLVILHLCGHTLHSSRKHRPAKVNPSLLLKKERGDVFISITLDCLSIFLLFVEKYPFLMCI